MKIFLTAVVCISLLMISCRKSCYDENLPACIKSNIEANKDRANWNVKRVDEYQYQGQVVYLFEPEEIYADMQTSVIKSDCTTLCALGGIMGNIMCNGENFSNKSTFIRTVWHK